MAIRAMCHLPDPVLRQKAKRVPTVDKSVQRLIDDMAETMQQANGVGLFPTIRSSCLRIPPQKSCSLFSSSLSRSLSSQ